MSAAAKGYVSRSDDVNRLLSEITAAQNGTFLFMGLSAALLAFEFKYIIEALAIIAIPGNPPIWRLVFLTTYALIFIGILVGATRAMGPLDKRLFPSTERARMISGGDLHATLQKTYNSRHFFYCTSFFLIVLAIAIMLFGTVLYGFPLAVHK